jgi:hypothetical protein
MRAYPVVNMLGQVAAAKPPAVAPDPFSQAGRQRLPCPPVRTDDPTLVCVQTRDGGVICSDGAYFPAGCAMPKYEEGEFATYTANQGFLFPVPPKAASLTAEVGGSFPIIPFAIALAGYAVSIFMEL